MLLSSSSQLSYHYIYIIIIIIIVIINIIITIWSLLLPVDSYEFTHTLELHHCHWDNQLIVPAPEGYS